MDPKEINLEIKGGLDAFLLEDDARQYDSPWINTEDDIRAKGLLDEAGEATPKGELFVELMDRGMFDQTGALTEKGRAYAMDERQLRNPDNWRAFKTRAEDGIDDPDIPLGDTISATAKYMGDAAVGGLERIKQEAQSLFYQSKTWGGFFGQDDNRPDWLKKEMDVTGAGVIEGGVEALAQIGSMADVAQGLVGEQIAKITGMDAAAEENLWKAKQRQWSLNKDIEEVQAGGILEDVIGLEGATDLMEQRKAELGDKAFDAQYGRASAAGNIFADPTNLLVAGVASKAARAVPVATRMQLAADRILVKKLAADAKIATLGVEAAAAERVALKSQGAATLATRLADDLAARAEATGDQVLSQRARQASEIAARTSATATKASDELTRITQQASELTAASEKLATRLPTTIAERTNQLLELGRKAKALPATVTGATLEKIGRSLTTLDNGLREVGMKYGVSQAYELLRSGVGQAGLYGSGLVTGPIGPAIGAAGTLLRSGGTIERLGQFTRTIGKEVAKARGSVPFWQRVGNYADLSPVHKATARFMSHVEMGGALPGAIRRTGRGVVGAYPVDLAFEYLAQGGEMDGNTLKQAFAESLVLGGSSAAIGGVLMGSKARHKQLAVADEMNFRSEMTDPVQRTLYNAIPSATRRSIATYAAIHPNLEFRFTNQGPSSYQNGIVTLNIAGNNPIRALAAHEVMHHVVIRHQMEEGIAAMLIGDTESGGLLRSANGTLDPAFQEFVDVYQKRLADSNLPPANLATIAVEYYVDQSADRLADMAESGELSQIASKTDMRRAIDRIIDATLPKLPIIRSLHFNLGGMMDQEGRVVMGNGLLADGMRELPQVKAMTRKMLRAGSGRAIGGFESMGGDRSDGKGGVTLPVAKGDKVMLDKLVALFATEEVNGKTRVKYDKNGDPIMIDAATDAARAEVGKVIAEIYNDLKRTREPGELYMAENGGWEGTHIGSDVLTELGKRGILNSEQMRILRNINSATKNFTGAVFSILNHPATRKVGKKVRYATLAPTLRQSVPVAVTITKDGNLLIGLMSVTQLEQNIQTRAVSRRGKKLYNGDTEAIRADVNSVMKLHRENQTTDAFFREKYGAERGDEFKNFINTVFGLVGGDAQRIRNPLFEADRIDTRDQVYRTYRLDRISQATRMDGIPAMPFSYGSVKMNLFPNGLPTLDDQGKPVAGQRNMPEPGGKADAPTSPTPLDVPPGASGKRVKTMLKHSKEPSVFEAGNATVFSPGVRYLPEPVYHGTPHKVDRFSLEKIGTGEGAQAYGWGIYFAESVDVANQYAKSVSDQQGVGWHFNGERLTAVNIVNFADTIPQEAYFALVNYFTKTAESKSFPQDAAQAELWMGAFNGNKKILKALEKAGITYKGGRLYTVRIKPEADEFLDWDKQLSEQSEKVRTFFRDSGINAGTINEDGRKLYERAARKAYQKRYGERLDPQDNPFQAMQDNGMSASDLLKTAGIRGIRYLDGNSRIPQNVIKQLNDTRIEVDQLKETLTTKPQDWDQRAQFERWLQSAESDLKALEKQASKPESYNYVIFDENDIEIIEENGKPVNSQP